MDANKNSHRQNEMDMSKKIRPSLTNLRRETKFSGIPKALPLKALVEKADFNASDTPVSDTNDDLNDSIKVGKALENPETQEEIEQSIKEDAKLSKKDVKNIGIILAVVIGIFILALGSLDLADGDNTSGMVKSVDELHKANLAGELSEDRGYLYNGFSFVKYDGLWWTILKVMDERLVQVRLHFAPKELEKVTVLGELNDDFNEGEEIFIAINPNVQDKYYTLAISELSFNVASGVGRTPVGTCTEENEACVERPILSCDHNPENKPIIELSLTGSPGVFYDGACVKLQGEEYTLVKSVDRFLYEWYQVMG